MKVIEVVKQYGLEDFAKEYKDVFGCKVSLKYPLDVLASLDVKDMYINLMQRTAEITVLPQREEY